MGANRSDKGRHWTYHIGIYSPITGTYPYLFLQSFVQVSNQGYDMLHQGKSNPHPMQWGNDMGQT